MSVIIRLQNLPWSANASDVRGFFRGLGIPDGGVHIVGGENGDAFIAFSTDEDARQAMMLNGSKLKETQVHLLLSSRAEMQKVIETARQQTMSFMNFSAQQPTIVPTPSLPVMAPQIAIPAIQAQPSMLNGANAVVGLMDPQLVTAKPQPPVITSSSLSGILAQQMLQQHQIQLIRQQQNMPVLTSTSVRHDSYKTMNQYNSMGHQYGENSMDSGKNLQGNDLKRSRSSRSRSRSRDRRDRRRSRSRERSRRYRDRSRSRERRRRSRRSPSSDRRSRSRERERSSRDSGRKGRSYDKDVRSSLDRNKSVDESISNLNTSVENNVNTPINAVDQHKPFNYSDGGAPNNNFNNVLNDGSNVPFNNFNTQSRNDYPTKSMNDFDPTMALVPFSNNSMGMGSCIRITNMNNRTHYAAIRKFFYGLQIPNDGIKLLNDENGKRTNDVVIRFARPDIARDALALDGKLLNGNTVRITSITDGDYENEVDSFQPPRKNASRFGNRYDDRNYSGDRGGSEENNRDGGGHRRNNRDYYDRGFQSRGSRFNDDTDGRGNQANDSRDRHGDDDDVMLISDSNDGEALPVGLTLLIEDLPPFAKEQDIIKMFSDFTLMDIMLTKVNKAFLAYVKFHNQTDAEAALKQTHLHRIDFKTVFVSPCSDETYARAKQEYDGIGDACGNPEVNTADEPTKSGRDDPRQNSPEGDNEVDQFGRSIRNRKFVQQQQQTQQQPSATDNKSQIPSLFNLTFDPPFMANQQPVPADPRLRRQFDQNNSQSPDSQLSPNQQPKAFNPFNQQGRIDPRLQRNSSLPLPNLTNNTNTKVIFIGNVEYNTTEGDIVGFFADIGPPPEGVFFVKNARGQPCGDCYVKFRSADDATRALIKNRFRFRSRVIRVTLAEEAEAEKLLGFSLSDGGDDKMNMSDNANDISSKGNAADDLASETRSEQNDKADNEMDMDGQNAERDGDNDQNGDDDNSGGGSQFSRDDPRMMYNNSPYARGGNIGDRAGNMMNMGNNNFRGGRGGSGGSDRGMRGNNYNRNNNSNNNSNSSNNGNNGNNNNNQRNLEGCIVGLSNVPFAATPRDIADFFGEYNLTPNDIIRRYNDDGSLTGEARVRFLTPMDASKAIDRHQRDRIGNRVIHLRLVT